MTFEYIFIFMVLLVIAIWIFLGFCVYFIPVIIAYIRKHNNILPITILTIFIGWTLAGWLAALLWSLNSDVKDKDSEE